MIPVGVHNDWVWNCTVKVSDTQHFVRQLLAKQCLYPIAIVAALAPAFAYSMPSATGVISMGILPMMGTNFGAPTIPWQTCKS